MRSFQSLKFQFVLLAAACPFLVLACTACDDDPVRPVNNLPACWKPLVADTAFVPDPRQPRPNPLRFGRLAANRWRISVGMIVVTTGTGGFYIAGAEGGARRTKLPVFGAFFKWMPGDAELIVNTGFGGGGELVIYNLLSDSIIPLGIQTRFPIFDISDDGRYIYYEGEPAPQRQGLSIFEYDRVQNSELALVAGAHPSISPDREHLAYAAGPLFLYSFKDSTAVQLAPGGSTPDWTPDGQKIVYANGLEKIFITDLQGNRRQITGQAGVFGAFGPVGVSPDGSTILYQQASDDFFQHIWRMNIDGSLERQFTQ